MAGDIFAADKHIIIYSLVSGMNCFCGIGRQWNGEKLGAVLTINESQVHHDKQLISSKSPGLQSILKF